MRKANYFLIFFLFTISWSWYSSQALFLKQLSLGLVIQLKSFPLKYFFEKLDPPSHTEVRASPSSGLLWSGFIGRKISRKGEKGCRSVSTFTSSYGGRPEKWNEGGRNFFVPGFLTQSFGLRPEVEMNFSFSTVTRKGKNNGNLKFDYWTKSFEELHQPSFWMISNGAVALISRSKTDKKRKNFLSGASAKHIKRESSFLFRSQCKTDKNWKLFSFQEPVQKR